MSLPVTNIDIVEKSCYALVALALIVGVVDVIAMLDLKSGDHRTKLRYSYQLPKIRDPDETDRWGVKMFIVVIISQVVFLIYLILTLQRLHNITTTSPTLRPNYISALEVLSIFITIFVLSGELKKWLEHSTRLQSANKLVGEEKFNMDFIN